MLSPIQKLIFNDFKAFIETFLAVFKFGIGLGAACLIYYLMEIQYLPNEISLGDGFVLFYIAIVFSVFLIFFIASEIALGMIVWNFISFIFLKITSADFRLKLNDKLNEYLGTRDGRNKFITLKIKKTNYLLIIPMIFFPISLFDFDILGFFWSILIGLFVYLFFNIIFTLSKEYNYFYRFRDCNEVDGEAGFYKGIITRINVKNKDNKSTVKFSFLLLVFFPVFYSGYFFDVPFKMLSSSMKLVNMRKENTIIYVKREYAEIILGSEAVKSKANYYSISKVTILFKGIGKNTYLQFSKNGTIQRLEIPNDAILNTVIIKED